jgi:hypothetical protein
LGRSFAAGADVRGSRLATSSGRKIVDLDCWHPDHDAVTARNRELLRKLAAWLGGCLTPREPSPAWPETLICIEKLLLLHCYSWCIVEFIVQHLIGATLLARDGHRPRTCVRNPRACGFLLFWLVTGAASRWRGTPALNQRQLRPSISNKN